MARDCGSPYPKTLKPTSDGADPQPCLTAGRGGGCPKRLDRRLKSAARRDVVRPAFKPESRFLQEYHGITHVVEVGDDGRFVWKDQSGE